MAAAQRPEIIKRICQQQLLCIERPWPGSKFLEISSQRSSKEPLKPRVRPTSQHTTQSLCVQNIQPEIMLHQMQPHSSPSPHQSAPVTLPQPLSGTQGSQQLRRPHSAQGPPHTTRPPARTSQALTASSSPSSCDTGSRNGWGLRQRLHPLCWFPW